MRSLWRKLPSKPWSAPAERSGDGALAPLPVHPKRRRRFALPAHSTFTILLPAPQAPELLCRKLCRKLCSKGTKQLPSILLGKISTKVCDKGCCEVRQGLRFRDWRMTRAGTQLMLSGRLGALALAFCFLLFAPRSNPDISYKLARRLDSSH